MKTNVALKRIAAFLDEPEVDEQVASLTELEQVQGEDESTEGLGIVHGSFRWNTVERDSKKTPGKVNQARLRDSATEGDEEGSNSHFELRDINVMFPEDQLTIITGPTGSGKTALLARPFLYLPFFTYLTNYAQTALLGETTLLSGRLIMPKSPHRGISYAAQTPWLRHQSIKDNILFGGRYEEGRYKEVLECCALNPDLRALEDGDETEIGARWVFSFFFFRFSFLLRGWLTVGV